MRLWARPGVRITLIALAFQGQMEAHQTPRQTRRFACKVALSSGNLISGRSAIRKKRQRLPRLPIASPNCFMLPNISTSWLGDINSIPYRKTKACLHVQSNPFPYDRLTHVQTLFTWSPSPLQSSKFSFEYLLLPPRSALAAVSPKLSPKAV